MMAQIVPTFTDPFYQQLTTLEGSTYLLSFNYNQRASCWYLSIATEEGDYILNGVKLICNWPLLRRCADPRLPQGELVCVTFGADLTPPGLTDLGDGARCQLVYFTGDELP